MMGPMRRAVVTGEVVEGDVGQSGACCANGTHRFFHDGDVLVGEKAALPGEAMAMAPPTSRAAGDITSM